MLGTTPNPQCARVSIDHSRTNKNDTDKEQEGWAKLSAPVSRLPAHAALERNWREPNAGVAKETVLVPPNEMQRTTSGPIGTCSPVRVAATRLPRRRGVLEARRSPGLDCRSALPKCSAFVEAQGAGTAISSAMDTVDDIVLGRCRALVLDVSWKPVGVVSWKRALCLHILEKVDVLEFYDVSIRSVAASHPLPAVLRARFLLKHNDRLTVPMSKRNILLRDNGTCAYCGATSNLTVDHVVPLSKGGPKSWDNVVTACEKCNSKKGDRTLKQLGWKLKKKPKKPSPLNPTFHSGFPQLQPAEWQDYISHLTSFKM